jgi:hypothetical protein
MEIDMKESFQEEKEMVREFTIMQVVTGMREIGNKIE